MSEAHLDAVLAGSRGFALALFVPLTEQVGTRPRVATDATQALTLLDSERGLVVVEVEGEGSVRSIRELLATRRDFTVVAAVPDAMAGQQDALRSLGVELAHWDGSPSAVLGAVSRRLGEARSGASAEVAPVPTPSAATAEPTGDVAATAAPPAAGAAAPFLADLGAGDDLDVVSIEDLGTEGPAPSPSAPVPSSTYAPPPPGAAWPAGGLTFAEAQKALARGLGGGFSGESKLRTVTEGVLNTLTALEFAVVSGDPVAVAPEPLRRAALMRIRVASALADRPPVGSAVDQGALSAMLGEIDALLSEVSALTQGAPPDVLPSLEAVRNALVKEAIDFSEAAQEIAPTERVPETPSATPTARRAPTARLLNVSSAPQAQALDRRTRRMAVAVVFAGLVAGGYHGWSYWQKVNRPLPPPAVAGAPVRATGGATPQGAKFLTTKDGKPFTDAEIETFRQREELVGRRVQLVAPNTILSVPAGAPLAPAVPSRPAGGASPTPATPSPQSQRPPGAAP